MKTRRSEKQRLQHNSASRAPLSLPRMGRSAPWCGAPGRATSAGPMVDAMATAVHLDKSGQHPTHHRASTHSSFSSSPAARQNHMENGPNFTYGKDLHMVGAYCSLMVQTPANQRYLRLVSLRHHSNRARDSFPPSCLLTHKCWSRPRVHASQ